jgi:hypothetical protein
VQEGAHGSRKRKDFVPDHGKMRKTNEYGKKKLLFRKRIAFEK